MDTTEQYVKMSDCEEIQKYKAELGLTHGDYIYNRVSLDWGIIYDATRSFRYGLLECTWLPTQSQLQEMVDVGDAFDFINWLDHNCLDSGYGGAGLVVPKWSRKLTSMEQFWLAFVMKEKFGKVWSDDEWVKD